MAGSDLRRIDPSDPAFAFHGRWQAMPPNDAHNVKTRPLRFDQPRPSTSRRAGWSSSSVSFRFTGRYLHVETVVNHFALGWIPEVAWRVTPVKSSAGKPSKRAKAKLEVRKVDEGENTFVIVESSERVDIEVTLYLATWSDELEIQGFHVDLHGVIAASLIPAPKDRILYIGASIESGFAPTKSNAGALPHAQLGAHPFQLRRALARSYEIDVHVDVIAFPGIKLTGGPAGMEAKFWQVSPLGETGWTRASVFKGKLWKASPAETRDGPTIIVTQLGTNDRGTGVSVDDFVHSLNDFLLKVSKQYSRTLKHVLVLNPFNDLRAAPDLPSYGPHLARFVERLQLPNGIRSHFVDTNGWLNDADTMDLLHPTEKGHQVIGSKMGQWMRANELL